jgi:hypothetical protein
MIVVRTVDLRIKEWKGQQILIERIPNFYLTLIVQLCTGLVYNKNPFHPRWIPQTNIMCVLHILDCMCRWHINTTKYHTIRHTIYGYDYWHDNTYSNKNLTIVKSAQIAWKMDNRGWHPIRYSFILRAYWHLTHLLR